MNFGDLSPFLTYGSARCAGTTYFRAALAALDGPVQNVFSSPGTVLFHLFPSPRKLGRQSCRFTCLLICGSGRNQ
jgi:hypothetical protein